MNITTKITLAACIYLLAGHFPVYSNSSLAPPEDEIFSLLYDGYSNEAKKIALSAADFNLSRSCLLWAYCDLQEYDSLNALLNDFRTPTDPNTRSILKMVTAWKLQRSAQNMDALRILDSILLDSNKISIYIALNCLAIKGAIARQTGNFTLLQNTIIHCKKIAKAKKLHARILCDEGSLHLSMSELEGSLKLYDSALTYMDTTLPSTLTGRLLSNIGLIYSKKQEYVKSSSFFLRSSKVYADLGCTRDYVRNISNLAELYDYKFNNYPQAKTYYRKGISILKENNIDIESYCALHINYGDLLVYEGNSDSGLYLLSKAQYIAQKNDFHNLEYVAYEKKLKAFIQILEADSAFKYLDNFNIAKENVLSKEKAKATKELQAKYKTELLERENNQKQKEIDFEKKKGMVATISLFALLIISILIIIIFRQRLKTRTALATKNQELHLQKLDELAKEKQLEKITALMEGQEQERKRISGELHDGLGSLLATIKHHFEVVEDKIDTNHEAYEKAYGLLDRASEEVRRISHNMASNILSKFGLVAALQDLAEMVNSSNQVEFELSISGMEGRLENSKEIHLFRICQELVSNALKHAEAKTIGLQITMRDDVLSLIVEDDGQGFEQEKAELTDGMGLSNLKARIDHLDGSLDIDSALGRGTTVVIEVPA